MASIRIERLEEMFADLRRLFAEETTRIEAEGIAIMTEVQEITGRQCDSEEES